MFKTIFIRSSSRVILNQKLVDWLQTSEATTQIQGYARSYFSKIFKKVSWSIF